MSRILAMHMLRRSTDSCLLAAITNHLLNIIISQVMLINRSRLATYGNHAIVTHAVYDIISCHDYKTSDVLHLHVANKPSSIFDDVMEIRINSQPCKANSLTTRHTRATKANKWLPFTMTIKESGWVLPCPSDVFHVKTSRGSPWVARTLSLLIICEAR
jgi:hypothetical protein